MGPYEAEMNEEYDNAMAVERAIEALHDAVAEFWEEEHGRVPDPDRD